MVEVHDVRADVGMRAEERQQGDAIGPAAHADGPGAGGKVGESKRA
jgi:hypothetical protein